MLPWLLMFLGAGLLLAARYRRVTLVVDDQARVVTTRARTVADLLQEQRIALEAQDVLSPAPATPLRDGLLIRLKRAYRLTVQVNRQPVVMLQTAERLPANILALAGVQLFPGDRLQVDGRPQPFDRPLPPGEHVLHVVHPLHVTLMVGTEKREVQTTQATVGALLDEIGVNLAAHDRLTPAADTPLRDGLTVQVQHARPVTVHTAQGDIQGWTVAQTVGDALSELGLPLQGSDRSEPPATAPIPEDGRIALVHVREEVLLEDTPIPFETQYQPLPDLEIDQQRVVQVGAYGLQTQRVRVRYENGQEVRRQVEETWVSRPPRPRIVGYGTRIVVRTLQTPDGPIEYWRAVTMYATSFSPCRLGIPNYCNDTTYSGQKLRKGLAAVVRSWYPYLSGRQVYVPGYGVATIADIGAGFPDRYWIDLGYEDEDWVSWHQYVTVYFLTPVPPPEQILWILP